MAYSRSQSRYTVTASFTVSNNYYPIDDKTATLTINKADITGITFTGTTVIYDGNTHPLAISGTLPSNVTVTYTNNDQKNYGTHTVTATFTVNNANYNTLAPMTATLTINKATVTGIGFADKTVTYDKTNSAAGVTAVNSRLSLS